MLLRSLPARRIHDRNMESNVRYTHAHQHTHTTSSLPAAANPAFKQVTQHPRLVRSSVDPWVPLGSPGLAPTPKYFNSVLFSWLLQMRTLSLHSMMLKMLVCNSIVTVSSSCSWTWKSLHRLVPARIHGDQEKSSVSLLVSMSLLHELTLRDFVSRPPPAYAFTTLR